VYFEITVDKCAIVHEKPRTFDYIGGFRGVAKTDGKGTHMCACTCAHVDRKPCKFETHVQRQRNTCIKFNLYVNHYTRVSWSPTHRELFPRTWMLTPPFLVLQWSRSRSNVDSHTWKRMRTHSSRDWVRRWYSCNMCKRRLSME
jgi:hypothetical protein